MARSQNGWPAGKASEIGVETYTVPGTNVAIPIKSGDVATVLLHVAARFEREVETLNPKGSQWCWGYAYRKVRGGQSMSNHSSGTAIDLNAPAHPLGKRGTFSPRQVRAIRSFLDELDGTVRWGGDYRNRADEMHFEINADAAAVAAVAARLEDDVLRRGDEGEAVRWVQRDINILLYGDPAPGIATDGVFGAKTEEALREAQGRVGVEPSGVFDIGTAYRFARRIAWSDDDRKRSEHEAEYHGAA